MKRRNFFLDPNAEPGTPSSEPATPSTPSSEPAAPSYVPSSDFQSFRTENESFRNEVTPRLQKLDEFLGRFNTPEQKAPTGEPKLGTQEFPNTPEGVQKWIAATADFRADSKIKAWQTESEKKASETANQAKRSTVVQKHVERIGDAVKRYKDWDAVVKNIDLPGNLADTIMDSDHSADIQYLINRDKGEYFKLIQAQSEGKADRVIGRLEARFEAESAARKQANRQTRHGATIDEGMDAGGNTSKLQELEQISSEYWKNRNGR